MKRHLWLFDIDGVLVNINRYHVIAYQRDYKKVLGVDVPDEKILKTFGKPESAQHKELLAGLGIQYSKSTIDRLIAVHPANFEQVINKERVEPLDGVVECLTELKENDQYRGVVTGNLERPARLILERAGLSPFFTIVSYDKGVVQRWQIVQAAIDEAKRRKYNFDKVIVLGDTPHDIEAGKKVGAMTVAVATGHIDIETLKAAQPNITLKSLKEYKEIQKYL